MGPIILTSWGTGLKAPCRERQLHLRRPAYYGLLPAAPSSAPTASLATTGTGGRPGAIPEPGAAQVRNRSWSDPGLSWGGESHVP